MIHITKREKQSMTSLLEWLQSGLDQPDEFFQKTYQMPKQQCLHNLVNGVARSLGIEALNGKPTERKKPV